MPLRAIRLLVLLMLPAAMFAGPVLWDWSVNVNGTYYNPLPLPPSVNSAGYDFGTGLGTMEIDLAPGAYVGGIYLNIFFDTGVGFSVTTDYANAFNSAPAALSWMLEDPNVTGVTFGDLFEHFAANTLDNTNHGVGTWAAPGGPPNYDPPCCDVGMAMMYPVTVDSGNTGKLDFTVSTSAPTTGFYLQENGHDTGEVLYLVADFTQTPTGAGPVVPEPGTWSMILSGAGLLVVGAWRRIGKRS